MPPACRLCALDLRSEKTRRLCTRNRSMPGAIREKVDVTKKHTCQSGLVWVGDRLTFYQYE